MINKPTIVIFGAGKGTRLGFNLPKPLVKINKKELITYQIKEISRTFPSSEIVVVGGYKFKKLQALFKRKYPFLSIHLVKNNDFDGSILNSFDTAISYLKENELNMEDIIRIDGDIYFYKNSLEPVKNVNQTTFFTNECDKETETVILKSKDEYLHKFEFLPFYKGNEEWACVERYFNNDFHKFWTEEIRKEMLEKGGHYFQYLERILTNLRAKINFISGTFEIDTLNDLNTLTTILNKNLKKE